MGASVSRLGDMGTLSALRVTKGPSGGDGDKRSPSGRHWGRRCPLWVTMAPPGDNGDNRSPSG